MTYACDDCGFLFSRIMEVTQCPVCDGQHVRKASPEERKLLEGVLDKQNSPAVTQTGKG